VTRAALLVRLGWLAALPLILCLVTLAPLCHASPPDPTWIAGLYDDDDHDDVVLDVLGSVALPPDGLPQVTVPAAGHGAVPGVVPDPPRRRSIRGRPDRAPPAP
jgi:hypothetical protein